MLPRAKSATVILLPLNASQPGNLFVDKMIGREQLKLGKWFSSRRHGTNYSMCCEPQRPNADRNHCHKHTLIIGGSLLDTLLRDRGLSQVNHLTPHQDDFSQILALIEKVSEHIVHHDCGDLVYHAIHLLAKILATTPLARCPTPSDHGLRIKSWS